MKQNPYKPGDILGYVRNSDGTTVWGLVMRVYDAEDVEGSRTYGGSSIFDNAQLREAPYAYTLQLRPMDSNRINHPVTIAHHRVLSALRRIPAKAWPRTHGDPAGPVYRVEGSGLPIPEKGVFYDLRGWDSTQWAMRDPNTNSPLQGGPLVRASV